MTLGGGALARHEPLGLVQTAEWGMGGIRLNGHAVVRLAAMVRPAGMLT